MKNIVYLLGAGATKAEMEHMGIESSTSMEEIGKAVYEKSKKTGGEYHKIVDKFGIPPFQNIERVISLFENVDNRDSPYLDNIYKELRKLFREYLISEITRKGIKPNLLGSLLHLHKNYGEVMGKKGEKMIGVLTTNYDGLTEDAFSEIYGGLNCGVEFHSENYSASTDSPPLLKLHGSFGWKTGGNGLEISKTFYDTKYEDDYSGWIPPSVYKKPSEGIFPEIWKTARELLTTDCDILRVIGSGLRNEDWALVSLIFTSRISSKRKFDIELIVPEESVSGDEEKGILGISQRLKFLGSVKPLSELPLEMDDGDGMKINNVFEHWLLKKASEADVESGGEIGTDEYLSEKLFESG